MILILASGTRIGVIFRLRLVCSGRYHLKPGFEMVMEMMSFEWMKIWFLDHLQGRLPLGRVFWLHGMALRLLMYASSQQLAGRPVPGSGF